MTLPYVTYAAACVRVAQRLAVDAYLIFRCAVVPEFSISTRVVICQSESWYIAICMFMLFRELHLWGISRVTFLWYFAICVSMVFCGSVIRRVR